MQKLKQLSKEVKELLDKYNTKTTGQKWSYRECAEGLVTDVGDLMKLIVAKSGRRKYEGDLDSDLKHELCDCLWSILTISDELGIDLEKEFSIQMQKLKLKINQKLNLNS